MTRRPSQRGAKVPETQDPAYYEALGRAIKVARTELGLSRKELAARAKSAIRDHVHTDRSSPMHAK